MNLATVDLSPGQASDSLDAYRRAGDSGLESYSKHDRIMVAACEEVLAGRQLVDIAACIRAGGTAVVEHWERLYNRDQGRHYTEAGPVLVPEIAVCRADAAFCWAHAIGPSGNVVFQGVKGWWRTKPRASETLVFERVFSMGKRYQGHRRRKPSLDLIRAAHLRALVPAVPVALRPGEPLAGLQILWEAEWQSNPPGDPALLKPLGGNLASVIATWDLTPLEKLALAAVRA